ncbi:unnamed protein product [Protopolystoma xenopodis]|uniref:Uncharacterized protein n=1 Tax=Protopolystoma xenopodis TaxID=117903 RepID=A0A448WAI2_9PLAT|nr:unnamed protein product [Protopolystoma xenopodis]
MLRLAKLTDYTGYGASKTSGNVPSLRSDWKFTCILWILNKSHCIQLRRLLKLLDAEAGQFIIGPIGLACPGPDQVTAYHRLRATLSTRYDLIAVHLVQRIRQALIPSVVSWADQLEKADTIWLQFSHQIAGLPQPIDLPASGDCTVETKRLAKSVRRRKKSASKAKEGHDEQIRVQYSVDASEAVVDSKGKFGIKTGPNFCANEPANSFSHTPSKTISSAVVTTGPSTSATASQRRRLFVVSERLSALSGSRNNAPERGSKFAVATRGLTVAARIKKARQAAGSVAKSLHQVISTNAAGMTSKAETLRPQYSASIIEKPMASLESKASEKQTTFVGNSDLNKCEESAYEEEDEDENQDEDETTDTIAESGLSLLQELGPEVCIELMQKQKEQVEVSIYI